MLHRISLCLSLSSYIASIYPQNMVKLTILMLIGDLEMTLVGILSLSNLVDVVVLGGKINIAHLYNMAIRWLASPFNY